MHQFQYNALLIMLMVLAITFYQVKLKSTRNMQEMPHADLWDTFNLNDILANTVTITVLSTWNNMSSFNYNYGLVEVEFYGIHCEAGKLTYWHMRHYLSLVVQGYAERQQYLHIMLACQLWFQAPCFQHYLVSVLEYV